MSHVVNTAWALLALLAAGYQKKDRRPLDAAARCLINSQLSSGDWPQQHISGVFNRNCMITYANYRWVWCLLVRAFGAGIHLDLMTLERWRAAVLRLSMVCVGD